MTYEKTDHPQQDRTLIQKKWRRGIERDRGKHQTVFNLSEDRIAALDAIAAKLYEENPHNPPRELSSTQVGRQAALDHLIDQWFKECTESEGDLVIEMMDKRKQNSEFFRQEATWRRCINPRVGLKSEIKKPQPPWSGNLCFIDQDKMQGLKQFRMVSESAPMEHKRWFDSYIEGSVFLAKDREDADMWLRMMCVDAGTDQDPFYNDLGPVAVEI